MRQVAARVDVQPSAQAPFARASVTQSNMRRIKHLHAVPDKAACEKHESVHCGAQGGQVAARVEGADAAALSAAVAEHIAAAEPPRVKPPAVHAAPAPAPQAVHEPAGSMPPASNGREGLGTADRITRLLTSAPVILFMKARPGQ